MKWTIDYPLSAGYYWHRAKPDSQPSICIVFYSGRHWYCRHCLPLPQDKQTLLEFTGEWCGPIAEPGEPTEDTAGELRRLIQQFNTAVRDYL